MGFGYYYDLYRKPNLVLVSIINHLKQMVTACVRLILVTMSSACYPRIAVLHAWVYFPERR
jgi:predicted benzoate:H+ symporter BenE